MSSRNLVISRLQNQRNRIMGMLSPGKKQPQAGNLFHAPLSPIAPDFAGRKFQRAAQKMRSLDPARLGHNLSDSLTSLSTNIHNKFADIHKILHINTGTAREENIWSSVETPLPESQLSSQVVPDEPGVLRSGSIIQKMSMLPKPGQSLASFKDQVNKKPSTPKPPVERKPGLGQKTRRYSQIQEVTPGMKPAFPESPLPSGKPELSQPTSVQEKASTGTETIQPQPEPSVVEQDKTPVTPSVETLPSRQQPDKKIEKASDLELPLPARPQPSEPVISSTQVKVPGEGEIRSTEQTDSLKPKKEKSAIPQPELPKALPVVKKVPDQRELKKAFPVKKELKIPVKPVARSIVQRMQEDHPAPIRPVIQRQADSDVSPREIEKPVLQQPVDTGGPEAPGSSQSTPGSPEMPLHQNIGYRKNAPRSMRAIAPDQMKPVALPPLFHREDSSWLKRRKYLPAASQETPRQIPPRKGPSPIPGKNQSITSLRIPDDLTMELPQRQVVQQAPAPENLSPIQMPLTPRVVSSTPAVTVPKTEVAKSVVQPVQDQAVRKPAMVARTNNTIQRTWEGHSPPSSQSSSAGTSTGESDNQESINLENLAQDVLPYIKRILEIEAERSSGKLR